MMLRWRAGFGYHTMIAKMECRKEIKKKAESLNKKAYARSLPFGQRMIYKAKDNKKKLLFLLLVGGLGWFYGYHRKLYYAIQRIQPFSRKFDRWVLGIPNKIPATIKEQDIQDVYLQPYVKDQLLSLYFENDRRLYYGVGRNMLFNVFSRLGLLAKDDQRRSYWAASGYYKERNQKIAGVSARQFLALFQQALQKLLKTETELTEDILLERFTAEFKQEIPQQELSQKYWYDLRDKELSKVASEDWTKEVFISNLISKDINAPVQQIEGIVLDSGLQGLAVKDRHQLVSAKIMDRTISLHVVEKKQTTRYKRRQYSTTSTNKLAKYRRQSAALQQELKQLKKQQEELEEQYLQYYGNPMY